MASNNSNNMQDPLLVWVDLEMTGLEPNHCHILQMAIVLTNTELQPIDKPLDLVIWQPDSVLESMSPFVRKMHEKSGLIDRVKKSELSLEDVQQKALALISKHAPYRTARLCGNSIWQDRRFLIAYMPTFEAYLHYRQIDVSSLKEMAEWWYKTKYKKNDEGKHTALVDIQQSIDELRYLRERIMIRV